MTGRRRVVILGMMTKMPVAGVVWQYLHYLLGFERLGFEAWYVEAHGVSPAMFSTDDGDPGTEAAADYLAGVMAQAGLDRQWAYHALHDDGSVRGLSAEGLVRLFDSAALVVNMHGATTPRPEHAAGDRLVYLETDPGRLQVELSEQRSRTIEFLEPHAAFFTFAESIGLAHCRLPRSDRFEFLPTRQPVVLDLWRGSGPPGESFTTVGNWRQSRRDVVIDGEEYTWSKHHEFRKVLDLPERTGAAFELALTRLSPGDRRRLLDSGWGVVEAPAISSDPEAYRHYLQSSRAEFTVAKDQNVRLQTGWFSDRSATYLAAGRAVVTQDTGFGHHLPTGEGLFGFSSVDEAAAAVAEVQADPERHGRAAAEVARHFEATSVLKSLLAEVGL